MLRHVASLAEIVEDVNEALKFYRDVLGLEVVQQEGDDYALLAAPGVPHFGIWSRAHAALSTLGSREKADQVPLGFSLEFEVDAVEETAATIEKSGGEVVQAPRLEPWGQKTCRMLSPSGGLVGFAETPWARKVVKPMEMGKDDE